MGDSNNQFQTPQELLQSGIDALGQTIVMEILGATPAQIQGWLSGEAEMDALSVDRMAKLAEPATQPDLLADAAKPEDVYGPSDGHEGMVDQADAQDLHLPPGDPDQPGGSALAQAGLPYPHQEMIAALRAAIKHAQLAQAYAKTPTETAVALQWQAELELALIETFWQSVPDPKEVWGEARRYHEIQTRHRRAQWAKDKIQSAHGGILGFIKRVVGIRPPTRKELYERGVKAQERLIKDVMEGGGARGPLNDPPIKLE